MEGILLLLIVFSIWQFIEHRKNRKQSDVNWAEVAQCEAELADAHPEKIIVLPTMEERIDSCYQTLEECQEEWLRSEAEFHAMLGEEDEASPFELFCQGCFIVFSNNNKNYGARSLYIQRFPTYPIQYPKEKVEAPRSLLLLFLYSLCARPHRL